MSHKWKVAILYTSGVYSRNGNMVTIVVCEDQEFAINMARKKLLNDRRRKVESIREIICEQLDKKEAP